MVAVMDKELSRNERNFRRYLKKYHPDKYDELVWLESMEKKHPDHSIREIKVTWLKYLNVGN